MIRVWVQGKLLGWAVLIMKVAMIAEEFQIAY
jgi:hypothetical protein